MSIFDNTVSFLSRALDLMSERHKLLSSNIANQDTPSYKAKDINFMDELRSAQGSAGVQDITRTNPMHLGGRNSVNGGANIINRPESDSGYDDNSVNVELEMANMAQNSILYNASAQVISTKFRMINNAIREGR